MKAFVLKGNGGIKDFEYVTGRPIPEPEKDEIRVKVMAAGLNPVDYQLAEGWGGISLEHPPVLGLDVAGVVDAAGADVTQFREGDRVFYHGNLSKANGGFAEYACTTAHTVSRLPDDLEYFQAAAIPCSGFTAYQAVMQKLKPEPGRTILIHGGAGGVGGYAVQLAKKLCGLTVYTTCSAYNEAYVKGLGADAAIDYSAEDVYSSIMRLTDGRGVDYAVDTLNSESATRDMDMLAFGGQLVAIEELPDFGKIKFFEKAISIHEVALGAAHLNGDYRAQRNLAEIGDTYVRLLQENKITLPAIRQISFEEIPAFLEKLRLRHSTGKIVAVL